MASKYSYLFSKKAMQDLNEILQYITETLCSPKAAQNLGRKIFQKIDTICTFPELGALTGNEFLAHQSVRRLFVDNYTIFYKVQKENQRIYIVRILYSKRNLDEIMRTLL